MSEICQKQQKETTSQLEQETEQPVNEDNDNDNDKDNENKNNIEKDENDKSKDKNEDTEENDKDSCHFSNNKIIETECERLLRNIKRQVKQMMEEAVTKKFIHEDSCSIISLCVAVDACLSHGLKRRTLDQLFSSNQTNSTTALIQKVAKSGLEVAQLILNMVEQEEKRITNAEQQQQHISRRQSLAAPGYLGSSDANNYQNYNNQKQPVQRSPSNSSVYKRNMWIKYALIENKLVDIVDYLSKNSLKYYESDALMSNYLCAQILSSLLMGLSALDFSRGKTNNYYQFDEPTAEELMKRHKLINPIACQMCNHRLVTEQQHNRHHQVLSRSITDSVATTVFTSTDLAEIDEKKEVNQPTIMRAKCVSIGASSESKQLARANCCSAIKNNNNTNNNKRKPLALKTNFKCGGTLITECHHYSCQEISERHQPNKGYSFLWCSSMNNNSPAGGGNCSSPPVAAAAAVGNQQQQPQSMTDIKSLNNNNRTSTDWPLWSPRMLHETLHQNSRSHLLYAKNNVLLETQPDQRIAGYLSLHQTHSDLILKWIPNQMINGGQHVNTTSTTTCESDIGTDAKNQEDGGSLSQQQQQQAGRDLDQQQLNNSGVSNALDCFYLDLVVNLSLSRVVLLQCQLQRNPTISQRNSLEQTKQNSGISYIRESQSAAVETTNQQQQQQQAGIKEDPIDNDDKVQRLESVLPEESMILIELDGVQRPPFKFPKGGLRSLISCLEQGLAPERHLELAIRFDEYELDPLQSSPLDSSLSTSLDSPPIKSELPNRTTESRFDRILRRLPSARRKKQQAPPLNHSESPSPSPLVSEEIKSTEVVETTPTREPIDTSNPKPDSSIQDDNNLLPTINYIYRIVSAASPRFIASDFANNQSNNNRQTPPLSAISVNSSSSGSFSISNGSGNNYKQRKQQSSEQQQQQANSGGQQSRWSLSRLTRFSTIRPNEHQDSLISNHQHADQQQHSICKNDNNVDLNSLDRTIEDDVMISEDTNDHPTPSSSDKKQIDTGNDDDVLVALRTQSIKNLCDSMRKQILARAFYGWLSYCRRMRIIRLHLIKLLNDNDQGEHDNSSVSSSSSLSPTIGQNEDEKQEAHDNHLTTIDDIDLEGGLTRKRWLKIMDSFGSSSSSSSPSSDRISEYELSHLVNTLVYYGGIREDEEYPTTKRDVAADNSLRREVWPYLLGHYKFKDNLDDKKRKDLAACEAYESIGRNWILVERVVKQRDQAILEANMARASKNLKRTSTNNTKDSQNNYARVGFGDDSLDGSLSANQAADLSCAEEEEDIAVSADIVNEEQPLSIVGPIEDDQVQETTLASLASNKDDNNTSDSNQQLELNKEKNKQQQATRKQQRRKQRRARLESTGSVGSDASLTDQFGNNIHRIDKDVQRCDRNFWYFKETNNLDKLRNIMCTYVWQHLDVGYVQGMCDLAAPFLVIFDDEIMAYNCFSQLMKKMVANFPHGSAMDQHFESLQYLMQVLDPKLYEIFQNNGDYTHFYFCYRWLLLDFKRELAYEDVYRAWETIWSARKVVTDHFVVFMALAMVRYYRDIIIENNMDFTDTIKFFNEMAEKHDAIKIMALARDCIVELQTMIRSS